MATSNIFDPHYYEKMGVRKFSEEKRFFRRDEQESLQEFSTNIGRYCCNEGLLRFLLAATRVHEDSQGKKSAMHTVKLPAWYKMYARNRNLDNNDVGSSSSEPPEEKNEVGYYSGAESDEEFYLVQSMGSKEVSGKTRFGPLSLADLQDPSRYLKNIQPYGRLKGDAVRIGIGRNGPAFRQTVRGVDLVCKQVAGIGCLLGDIEEQIDNLTYEMYFYSRMEKLQGTPVPRFLFAGKLVDNRFWVCPEQGHLYGLATTWEGESLDTTAGVDRVSQMLQNANRQERDIEEHLMSMLQKPLQQIHDCGIFHNDMELRNTVCNGKKLAFVDFDDAVILGNSDDTKDQKLKSEIRRSG